MRNCGVTKTLCAGVVARTRFITPKKQPPWPKHWHNLAQT